MGATRRAALLDSLRRTIQGLRWNPGRTEWADYDRQTPYSDDGTVVKEAIVDTMLRDIGGSVAWDLGANQGRFSAIAARLGRRVVTWDLDPAASERHYQRLKLAGTTKVLPLVQDLVNPSPGIGWASAERAAFVDQSGADVVLALALVHHLAIANNVPLERIVSLFARLAPNAIVEFVPKDDPMARRLLASRRDVFPDYTQDGFDREFGTWFRIVVRMPIVDSTRVLYRMERA
jgi:ribosomal protein L11 methylase PrmA